MAEVEKEAIEKGRPPTREAQNKMAIGIEASNDSSSAGWRRVAVRSVGVTGKVGESWRSANPQEASVVPGWAVGTDHLMAT